MKINISNKPVSSSFVVFFLLFSAVVSLSCCYSNSGHGPRSTMWDKDASAACLEEISQFIENSDADSLVAVFSEKARSTNPHLDSQANSFMNLLGGGTIDKDPSIHTLGSIKSGSIFITSHATITAPNGTVWELHVTDCTYNKNDPSRVGLWAIDIYPANRPDEPESYASSSEMSDPGISIVENWEEWYRVHPYSQ